MMFSRLMIAAFPLSWFGPISAQAVTTQQVATEQASAAPKIHPKSRELFAG